MDEVDEVTQTARRIAAILLMSEALDANYEACKHTAGALGGGLQTVVCRRGGSGRHRRWDTRGFR